MAKLNYSAMTNAELQDIINTASFELQSREYERTEDFCNKLNNLLNEIKSNGISVYCGEFEVISSTQIRPKKDFAF